MLFIYGPLEYDRESLASKEHFQPLTQLFPNISLSKKKKKKGQKSSHGEVPPVYYEVVAGEMSLGGGGLLQGDQNQVRSPEWGVL